MTATTSSSSEVNDKAKRIRREWLFPRLSINDVRMFIDKIATDGSGEKMRRINLLDLCQVSDSGHTREKITVSQSYGLTVGSYVADFIEPTPIGLRLAQSQHPKSILIDIIVANEYFKKFHDRYADKKVPNHKILKDWSLDIGIPADQADTFTKVVLENAHTAGLIQTFHSGDMFVSIDHAREQQGQDNSDAMNVGQITDAPAAAKEQHTQSTIVPPLVTATHHNVPKGPEVHIDINIHIASDSSPEHIDAVFASMAKHFYSRTEEQ